MELFTSYKLTCNHQGEIEAFLHRFPVDLVWQSCKTHILFLLEDKIKTQVLLKAVYFQFLFKLNQS